MHVHKTKTTTNKVKTPGDECGGILVHKCVDNGGHGFSLGYKRGAFMESFLNKKVCKTGQACIKFRNFL